MPLLWKRWYKMKVGILYRKQNDKLNYSKTEYLS